MHNLYQSKIRKDIQTKVYNKPYFTIKLFNKEYFGLIKEKKIGPFKTKRLQIMGVELGKDNKKIKKELKRIYKIYKKEKGNIFLQFGVINEIKKFDNVGKRSKEFKEKIKKDRLNIRQKINTKLGLKTAFRENMPQANIIYDITKTDEQLISEMNSGCKERVKKAIKKGINFNTATKKQYKEFYQKRSELSNKKGFNIIPKHQYEKLIEYMDKNKCGKLFISEINGDIIAGSICIYDNENLTYLYGFSNRKYSNIGGHHYLKFKIFGRARKNGLKNVDMMGGAPTGFENHPLNGVSKFKESLGGTKVEQYGSYDLVINPLLYLVFKIYYKLKKH